ncbi:MAG: hypothetical protein AB7H90_00795 [Alphaproteobacteria bacterium]
MALLDIPRALWSLGRKVEDLLALQTKTREALELVDKRLRTLEDRMTQLEARENQVVTEARSAASTASTAVTAAVISDIVTRLTRVEVQVEQASIQKLPSREQLQLPLAGGDEPDASKPEHGAS